MFRRRLLVLSTLMVVAFFGLIGRLAYLQLVAADKYAEKGEKRRVRLKTVPPARGRILDRVGNVLAADMSSFDLWLQPAKMVRQGRRSEMQSLLGDLSTIRLQQIAESRGARGELERRLALRYLVEASELTASLAVILGKKREEVAVGLLDAALKYTAGDPESLLEPRLCFDNVPFSAYLQIRQERESPFGGTRFEAIEPRLGFRRVYPGGVAMGQITGVDGHLNAEDYRQLRGYWDEHGQPHPGTGVIRRNGREYFRIDPGSDEEQMLRLRESDRAGKHIRYAGYLENDMIGFSGVEEYYNEELRGRHQWQMQQMVMEDGSRQFVNAGGRSEAKNGQTVVLTIELEFQKRVREIMLRELEKLRVERNGPGGKPFVGAAVVMDARTGAIRAMVSVPGYDPNTYRENYARLLADPRKPLINRIIAGRYPPGSTLKPVLALGMLNSGRISSGHTEFCEGEIPLGGHMFICHDRHRHGSVDISTALKKSCNIFFYRSGEKVGPRRLYDFAWDLGMGKTTRIDLAGEARGVLPEDARTGKGWGLGSTFNMSIGQGAMTATPLQLAVSYAAIANGGTIVRPHVRYNPQDPSISEPVSRIRFDEAALRTVREGMWRVVNEQGGTGYSNARIPGLEYSGKTGSAQQSKTVTHAWFACFAPSEEPEVVCVVVVPDGNLGGTTSGPIAKRIVMEYFHIIDPDEQNAAPEPEPAAPQEGYSDNEAPAAPSEAPSPSPSPVPGPAAPVSPDGAPGWPPPVTPPPQPQGEALG